MKLAVQIEGLSPGVADHEQDPPDGEAWELAGQVLIIAERQS